MQPFLYLLFSNYFLLTLILHVYVYIIINPFHLHFIPSCQFFTRIFCYVCTVCDMEWCNHHNNNHTLLTTILNQFFLLTPLCFMLSLQMHKMHDVFAALLLNVCEHTHHNTIIITSQPSSCENA